MYKPHRTCRACGYARSGSGGSKSSGSEQLVKVFDLGLQPLANDFCEAKEERSGYAPLEVLYCPNCSLAQLSVTVNPEILYRHYSYVTSSSQMMLEHFENLIRIIEEEQPINRVVEIGSNDGRFLKFLVNRKQADVCGVDPAKNLGDIARKEGVPTLTGLLNRDAANELCARFPGNLDVIIARHVFCHIDNWQDFMLNTSVPSTKETLLCIEVPYAKDLLEHCEFDTIYHEHLSYLTIEAIKALTKRDCPWRLHRIHHLPIHGGAILIMLRRVDSTAPPHVSVEEYLRAERLGLKEWEAFRDRANDKIVNLKSLVRAWRADGKVVAGYGASAKATVWINACGFTKKDIAYVTDTTPAKQWRTIPGSDIPVAVPGVFTADRPDFCILFAWNYADEIIRNEAKYRANGGKWIIPNSDLKVI